MFLTDQEWYAVRLSLGVAVCVVLLSLPFAVVLGYVLARHQFRGKWLIEIAANLPLVLPPVVTGYLLLMVFGRYALVGRLLRQYLGLKVAFDWNGLVVAAAVMSFPLMLRAVRLGFQSVDRNLEIAARTLGAGRVSSFFTVSLPLARHGVIAGCVLAFARSMGEFGATAYLVGMAEKTRTIALLVYVMKDQPGRSFNEAWRIVIVSIVIAGAALVASEYLERRGLRRESA